MVDNSGKMARDNQDESDVDDLAIAAAKPVDLSGKRFALVPLTPEYHRAIYQLSISQQLGFRWRFHSMMPTFETFERNLHTNVLVQCIVCPRSDAKQVAGLVVAYNANLQDGYVYVATISNPAFGAGSLEGLLLFLRYLFANFPLRKIYFETIEFNVSQFQSAVSAGVLKEEARLRQHRYYGERYWDYITFALYRDDARAFVEDRPGIFPEDVSGPSMSS